MFDNINHLITRVTNKVDMKIEIIDEHRFNENCSSSI
jgi:hypothetical protein